MSVKSEERKISEAIQAVSGESLISINLKAMRIVQAGLFMTRKYALLYLLDIAK